MPKVRLKKTKDPKDPKDSVKTSKADSVKPDLTKRYDKKTGKYYRKQYSM